MIDKIALHALCDQYKLNKTGRRFSTDGHISIQGSVVLSNKKLTEIPIPFEVVGNTFAIINNSITSLKNSPWFVGWDFRCNGNNLTSLEFGPTDVARSYDVSDNPLTSLKGIPKRLFNIDLRNTLLKPSDLVPLLFVEFFEDFKPALMIENGYPIRTSFKDPMEITEIILANRNSIDGKMPRELIPNKINQLRDLD